MTEQILVNQITEYIEHCSLQDLLELYCYIFGETQEYKEAISEIEG